jgi:EAL domain-containing protein (putative c-di-GMP-specific phosphodiesterase class I)
LLKHYASTDDRYSLTEKLFKILCKDLKTRQTTCGWRHNISFNIDAHVFECDDLPATLSRIVEETGIEPGHFTIELTETQLPKDLCAYSR